MSHHSLKDRVSSHLEERDVVEIKKALATSGADKERAASSAAGRLCLLLHVNPTHVAQVSSIACYCLASILMTLVNKVAQFVSLRRPKRLTDP
jgi:hypothetical protein